MKYTHVHTGPDGQTHFEDLELPMKISGTGGISSNNAKAVSISFTESRPGQDLNWHNPRHRQYAITLGGQVDIVSGAGITRRFVPGDVFLADDMTGQGHITHVVGSEPWTVVFVALE